MSSGGLRDTFALLLRESHDRPATLSADAERAIRRRITARWAGRIGALVVVGTLGTAAVAGASGGGGADIATKSAIPTPTIGFAAATFPLAGGPEFVPASSGVKCGDPAPAPHSVEHGLKLEVKPSDSAVVGPLGGGEVALPSAKAVLSPVTNEVLGTVSTSGIAILVVQDGIIKGVFDGDGTELKIALSSAKPADWPGLLVTERTHCSNGSRSEPSGVAPGTYQLVAIGSIFSTPESVALSQAMGSAPDVRLLDAETQTDPHAVYRPGSYDCHQLLTHGSVVRACLPDLTDNAVVDAKAGTVSVLYKTKGLVDEYATVLVSEPLTATLVSSATLAPSKRERWAGISPFETLDSFTCGAIGLGLAVGVDANFHVEASPQPGTLSTTQLGGTFPGTVYAPDAPDDSTVELLPGARLVFFRDYQLVSPQGRSFTNISTVVAWADVTAAGATTTDRYTGPQATMFTVDSATVCPGAESEVTGSGLHTALVGQWGVNPPDGTVSTVDSATEGG